MQREISWCLCLFLLVATSSLIKQSLAQTLSSEQLDAVEVRLTVRRRIAKCLFLLVIFWEWEQCGLELRYQVFT